MPTECEPGANAFIERYLHDCVYCAQDLLGFCLGLTSILLWITAQLPQFIDNIRNQSAEALSVWFLAQWFLGDTLNLLGCLLQGEQLATTKALAMYFLLSDVIMLTQFVFYTALNRRKDAMRKRLKARKHSHSHPHQHHGSGGASSGAVTTTGSSSGAMHRQGSAHGPGGSSSSQHRGSGMGMSGSDYHSGAEGSASGSMMGSSGAAAASGAGVAGTAAAVGVSTAPGTLLIAAVACVSLLSLGVLGLGSAWDGGLHGAPMQDPSRSLHVAGAAAAAPHASAHAAVSSAMHAHAHGEQPDMQLAAGSPPGSIGAVMRHSSGRGHQAGSGAEPEPGGAAGSLQQLGWPWDQPGVNIEQLLGSVFGYCSTVLYLTSRFSQIYKNWSRRSAEGLSVAMFLFTISANLCTGCSILLRLKSYEAFLAQLPWIAGSFGTVTLDAIIYWQATTYNKPGHGSHAHASGDSGHGHCAATGSGSHGHSHGPRYDADAGTATTNPLHAPLLARSSQQQVGPDAA